MAASPISAIARGAHHHSRITPLSSLHRRRHHCHFLVAWPASAAVRYRLRLNAVLVLPTSRASFISLEKIANRSIILMASTLGHCVGCQPIKISLAECCRQELEGGKGLRIVAVVVVLACRVSSNQKSSITMKERRDLQQELPSGSHHTRVRVINAYHVIVCPEFSDV